HDVEREVNPMHKPGPNADRQHEREDMLHINPKQREKWNEEMAEDNDQADVPPRALFTHDVPKRFLRHVAVPDDEVLGESDVGIEHRESEQARAEKIILMLVKDIGEHALAIENHGDDI